MSVLWVVPLLRCPNCEGALELHLEDASEDQGTLVHGDDACSEVFPVIDGIPRLLVGPARASLVRSHAAWFGRTPARSSIAARWAGPERRDRVVEAFDAEWTRFAAVGTPELSAISTLYFDMIPPHLFSSEKIVLDAGCGAGRWAQVVAARGPRVIAVDLGRSVEVARRNLRDHERIACVQADLRALPIAPEAVDWAYSLGVLHHIEDPAPALDRIVFALKRGGLLLLYLYYAIEGRPAPYRAIFRLVDLTRRLTSRAPRPLLEMFALVVAMLVYWPLARASALFARLRLHRIANAIPLTFYRERSFTIMRNDSVDRFGTSVEHRYTRDAMERLMRQCGIEAIRFSNSPPYWHVVGTRRAVGVAQ